MGKRDPEYGTPHEFIHPPADSLPALPQGREHHRQARLGAQALSPPGGAQPTSETRRGWRGFSKRPPRADHGSIAALRRHHRHRPHGDVGSPASRRRVRRSGVHGAELAGVERGDRQDVARRGDPLTAESRRGRNRCATDRWDRNSSEPSPRTGCPTGSSWVRMLASGAPPRRGYLRGRGSPRILPADSP